MTNSQAATHDSWLVRCSPRTPEFSRSNQHKIFYFRAKAFSRIFRKRKFKIIPNLDVSRRFQTFPEKIKKHGIFQTFPECYEPWLSVSQLKLVNRPWQSELHLKMILKIFKMYKCLIWTLYICTPPMLEANKYDHYTTGLQANELSSPSDNLGFSLKLYLFLKLLSFSIKSVGHCINNLVCNFNLSIFPKNLLEIKNYPHCFIFIHYTVMLKDIWKLNNTAAEIYTKIYQTSALKSCNTGDFQIHIT